MIQLFPDIAFDFVWASSPGDRDQSISLRTLGSSDLFTRDLDELLLNGSIRIAIHSAKDLPDPLPQGTALIALTKGVDPRDSLVIRDTLPESPLIATSSARREKAVRQLYPQSRFIDVRGTIGERLALLERGEVDGVVVAEAALIRLKITDLHRIILSGDTAPMQGRLAILARIDDEEMRQLFENVISRD